MKRLGTAVLMVLAALGLGLGSAWWVLKKAPWMNQVVQVNAWHALVGHAGRWRPVADAAPVQPAARVASQSRIFASPTYHRLGGLHMSARSQRPVWWQRLLVVLGMATAVHLLAVWAAPYL